MMDELLKEVLMVEGFEYDRAAERYGAANCSLHEGYAIILEELEEAKEEEKQFQQHMFYLWEGIKGNDGLFLERLKTMEQYARNAAAEWVQVAAMCYKAYQKKGGDDNKGIE